MRLVKKLRPSDSTSMTKIFHVKRILLRNVPLDWWDHMRAFFSGGVGEAGVVPWPRFMYIIEVESNEFISRVFLFQNANSGSPLSVVSRVFSGTVSEYIDLNNKYPFTSHLRNICTKVVNTQRTSPYDFL